MVPHIKKYIFLYALIPLLLFTVIASFYRFIILNDYLVSYEGGCDPTTESCFIGCENEECTEEYFYSIIERHAVKINTLCGDDISECDDAYECPVESSSCFITYCNDSEDECSNITDL
jgi:hypothetical protein